MVASTAKRSLTSALIGASCVISTGFALQFPASKFDESNSAERGNGPERNRQLLDLNETTTSDSLRRSVRRRTQAYTAPIQKKSILIGEDCSREDTACEYFRPMGFYQRQPKFISVVSQLWRQRSMEGFCESYKSWAVEMFGFDCDEPDIEQGEKYCRPGFYTDDDLGDLERDPYWFLPRSFTFKHVRKAGGNSFLETMWSVEKRAANNISPKFSVTKIRASIDGPATHDMATERMDEMMTAQQRDRHSHPLVLALRNPVERFVSASAQVLYDLRDSELCHDVAPPNYLSTDVATTMNNSTANNAILRCILDQATTMTNIHLIPMYADIYCNLKGRDVEVSVYKMDDYPQVLKTLGAKDPTRKKNPNPFSFTKDDLDEDMIRKICELYAWDVAMMEYVGFNIPECELGALS